MKLKDQRIVFIAVIILFSIFISKDIFFPSADGKSRWISLGLDLFVIAGNCVALKMTGKKKSN